MNIKRRVFEVWLSDQKTQVIVKSPSMEQFTQYLDSFGVIQRIGSAFQNMDVGSGGTMDFAKVRISQSDLDEFYPLLSVLSLYRELKEPIGGRDTSTFNDSAFVSEFQPVTVDDYKGLAVNDGMAIIMAYVQLLSPEKLVNPTPAEATTPPLEVPVAGQPS